MCKGGFHRHFQLGPGPRQDEPRHSGAARRPQRSGAHWDRQVHSCLHLDCSLFLHCHSLFMQFKGNSLTFSILYDILIITILNILVWQTLTLCHCTPPCTQHTGLQLLQMLQCWYDYFILLCIVDMYSTVICDSLTIGGQSRWKDHEIGESVT